MYIGHGDVGSAVSFSHTKEHIMAAVMAYVSPAKSST
jgi:hypothetical protein